MGFLTLLPTLGDEEGVLVVIEGLHTVTPPKIGVQSDFG